MVTKCVKVLPALILLSQVGSVWIHPEQVEIFFGVDPGNKSQPSHSG